MREAGLIERVEGSTAYVRFQRTSACGKCGACGLLAGQNEITVEVQNSLNAREGQRVEVDFTTKNAYTSSALAYLFPLGMLFLGVLLGNVIPQTVFPEKDAFAALLGVAGAAVGFLVLKLCNPYFKKKFKNVYTMVRVVNGEAT